MDTTGHGPLGQTVNYPSHYDPSLLHAIARAPGRAALGLMESRFLGADIWHAYELSWLNPRGKPQVACARFVIPADSVNIIESKSFKLYLNSFNQHRLAGRQAMLELLTEDLSAKVAAPVQVSISEPASWQPGYDCQRPQGQCLDHLDVAPEHYQPTAALLACQEGGERVSETLYSDLLRSRCPVTGQPDWATVSISYTGTAIDHRGLLLYLISFREHDDFHEHCIERIYRDIEQRCRPDSLSVHGRYLRRGGLDINPWRSSEQALPVDGARLPRQ